MGEDGVDPDSESAVIRSVSKVDALNAPGPKTPAFPCLIRAKALPFPPPSRARLLFDARPSRSKSEFYGFEPQNL
jgi:hypothetical protein